MSGPIALIGGEGFTSGFVPALNKLAEISGGDDARVVVLPTAAADDGKRVPEQRAQIALDFFSDLGIRAEAAMILDKGSANDPLMVEKINNATWIHISGGHPPVLRQILEESAAWQAIVDGHAAGKTLVGSSAGAVMFGEHAFAPRRPFPPDLADLVFDPLPGFNLLPGIAVAPHFNGAPPELITRFTDMMPPDVTLTGIDETTGLLGSEDTWQVIGTGTVTLIRDNASHQYPSGAVVPLFE